MAPKLYRQIRPEQEGLIAGLTERYAAEKIRFDTSFNGSIPVQACGRIGRQFFYFRFRSDSASLVLGKADRCRSASQAKHARRKALRTLRRGNEAEGPWGSMVKKDLKKDTSLDRHPSCPVWYAVIYGVTGEPYAGALEAEESAELFVELMNRLEPVPQRKSLVHKFRAMRRGSYTPPSRWTQGIIRKPSKTRR